MAKLGNGAERPGEGGRRGESRAGSLPPVCKVRVPWAGAGLCKCRK